MSPLNDAPFAHATPLAGKLSKLAGFGLQSLREVEAVFFPGQCYLADLKDGQRPSKKMHIAAPAGLGLASTA